MRRSGTLDRLFVAMIVDRYEADIAFSFAHSLRRNIDHGLWKPVAYSFPPPSKRRAYSMAAVHRRLPVNGRIDIDLILTALQRVHLAVPFRDLQRDACGFQRSRAVHQGPASPRLRRRPAPPRRPRQLRRPRELRRLRSRARLGPCARPGHCARPGCYLVPRCARLSSKPDSSATAPPSGRPLGDDHGTFVPFVVALLNSPEGVSPMPPAPFPTSTTFSARRWPTSTSPPGCTIRPACFCSHHARRPFGHHYSTIGFNHVGKVAILDEIVGNVRSSGQRLQRSQALPGPSRWDSRSTHARIT